MGRAPTFDLRNCFDNGFAGTINAAYGITGAGGATYAALTDGRDPALMDGTALRSVRC